MNSYPPVTLTITTGGRLSLFLHTMESFMDCCKDLDLIQYWLLSDDRSTVADLVEMKKRYPIFKIMKTPRPGQAANVNHLFSRVETEWFVHIEDDWEFIKPGHFIREMFDIAFSDHRIKNVVLRHWQGMYIVDGHLNYMMQYFNRKTPLHMMKTADTHWYGYSLNPGLQHLPTVKAIGKYDEDFDQTDRFWDRPPAKKYLALGCRRANLMDNYVKHIGEGHSAYERNK